MGGGLMQLVAYGAQDIYLTGNPQITFFKVVYRRHTNFSMEEIAQTPNGVANYGQTASYTISRNGDLVHKMYLEFTPVGMLKAATGKDVGPHLGHTLLKEVECEIGGQKIDKHYSHWLATWNQLTDVNPTGVAAEIRDDGASSIAEPITGATLYNTMSYNHKGRASVTSACTVTATNNPTKCMVPLQFWFNRNPGLALPLIALQYHEVKIKITFCAKADLVVDPAADMATAVPSATLYAQYIYLDTDERRRFAQVSHEYLIEQLQFQDTTVLGSMNLNFNHPVKEVIWGRKASSTITATTGPSILQEADDGVDRTFHLKLNGHDRFAPRSDTYFTRQQVYDHHSGFGGTVVRDSIFVYSFALKPEEHQPSGTCNFSRIDTAQLVMGGTPLSDGLYIYAVNYNVLRIMSGMGGLAYSN